MNIEKNYSEYNIFEYKTNIHYTTRLVYNVYGDVNRHSRKYERVHVRWVSTQLQ